MLQSLQLARSVPDAFLTAASRSRFTVLITRMCMMHVYKTHSKIKSFFLSFAFAFELN